MVVTGTSYSRLSELKKYKPTDIFTEKYWGSGTSSNDGVVYSQSNPNVSVVYYIGGIKYVDNITGNTTTFSFVPVGTNSANFISKRIYKDPNKSEIYEQPKIDNDVFIDRQEVSAFEKNYRLEHVKNLSELIAFASGRYFNITNNN